MGTGTDGALVTPSGRASLYALKPSIGLVDGANIIPTSARYDTAGPIGKTPKDIASLLEILVDHGKPGKPSHGYTSTIAGDWADISVGTLDPDSLSFPDSFCKILPEADNQRVRTLASPLFIIFDDCSYLSWNKQELGTVRSESLRKAITRTYLFLTYPNLILKGEMLRRYL